MALKNVLVTQFWSKPESNWLVRHCGHTNDRNWTAVLGCLGSELSGRFCPQTEDLLSGKSIPVIPSDSRDPILLSILPFPVGQQKGRRRCPVAMEQICDLEEGIIVSGGAAVPYLDFRFSNRRRGKENPQEVFSAREALRVFQESRQGKWRQWLTVQHCFFKSKCVWHTISFQLAREPVCGGFNECYVHIILQALAAGCCETLRSDPSDRQAAVAGLACIGVVLGMCVVRDIPRCPFHEIQRCHKMSGIRKRILLVLRKKLKGVGDSWQDRK